MSNLGTVDPETVSLAVGGSLGFELGTIAAILNDPSIDELEHLRQQPRRRSQ